MNLKLKLQISLTVLILAICLSAFSTNKGKGLKDLFQGKFYIGTAMNTGQITGKDIQRNCIPYRRNHPGICTNILAHLH